MKKYYEIEKQCLLKENGGVTVVEVNNGKETPVIKLDQPLAAASLIMGYDEEILNNVSSIFDDELKVFLFNIKEANETLKEKLRKYSDEFTGFALIPLNHIHDHYGDGMGYVIPFTNLTAYSVSCKWENGGTVLTHRHSSFKEKIGAIEMDYDRRNKISIMNKSREEIVSFSGARMMEVGKTGILTPVFGGFVGIEIGSKVDVVFNHDTNEATVKISNGNDEITNIIIYFDNVKVYNNISKEFVTITS